MTYKQMCSHLHSHGWQFLRSAKGSHELWKHPNGGRMLVSRGKSRHHGTRAFLADLKRKQEVQTV